MRNWEDGYTYEMYERTQNRANNYDNDFADNERKYRVDWFNSEYEDTEFVTAYSESEAEEIAIDMIPTDAIITSIRVA